MKYVINLSLPTCNNVTYNHRMFAMSKVGELHKLISSSRVENAIIRKAEVHTDKGSTLIGISLFLGSQSDCDRQFMVQFVVKDFSTNNGDKTLFGYFISRILHIAEVEQFSELTGKYIRVYIGSDNTVIGISHILKHDYLFPILEIEN